MGARTPANATRGDLRPGLEDLQSGKSSEGSSTTLGDLLYSDRTKVRPPEEEWVTLVSSMVAGHQWALRALYERTHRVVFALALRITAEPQAAAEVTLDVFHDVWRQGGSYDPARGTVLAWIMNQVRSRAIDRSSSLQPGETLLSRQQGRLLRGALIVLTAGEREAIETAYFLQLTHLEVAEKLNEPLETIKSRIRSGLDKMRRALVPPSVQGEPT